MYLNFSKQRTVAVIRLNVQIVFAERKNGYQICPKGQKVILRSQHNGNTKSTHFSKQFL